MVERIRAAWAVLQAGSVVANPTAWKQGQVTANLVFALLSSAVVLLKSFGYDLHLDDETLVAVAGGIFALVNWLFTVVSTDKVGALGGTVQPPGETDHQAANDLRGGP